MNKLFGFFLIFNFSSAVLGTCNTDSFCTCTTPCSGDTYGYDICVADCIKEYPGCSASVKCSGASDDYLLSIKNESDEQFKIAYNYEASECFKEKDFISPSPLILPPHNQAPRLTAKGAICFNPFNLIKKRTLSLSITMSSTGSSALCKFGMYEDTQGTVCTIEGHDVVYAYKDSDQIGSATIGKNPINPKPQNINFTFENNSSYPITITPADTGTCWTVGTGEGGLRTFTIDKTNHNPMGEFITSIDTTGTCLKEPSNLNIKFSSDLDSAPVTFMLSGESLSTDPLAATIGDKINVEFSYKGNVATVTFSDKT
ncbi:hypothetical protein Bealeia1_01895 [Candidatus Bealeia paramacronuclearis]|uniref:Uncharacterized protein n=1 Tax=Candidatus Bealeia paramacronuclearis TaxID=1921001 RepID=A0ABZ2CBG1_9PROT|nr:hypothetical protein [Candidatus Bealeia paramacronuclearis]